MDSLWRLIDNRAFVLLSLLVLSVGILMQSPLAPYAKGCVYNDSGIFITIAKNILDGDVLYQDITDHKGPLIFLMDAMGILLTQGRLVGIWFLEVLSLYVASIYTYRTARLLFDRIISLMATWLCLLFLTPVLMGGNLTEEWALPYIAIALYIFVKHLKSNRELTYTQLFVLSLTFVMAFLLKVTYVCVWCAFGLVIVVNMVKDRKYGLLVKYLVSILMFILLVMMPFVLYFMYHDALGDAYYWMMTFNIQYSEATHATSTPLYLLQMILGVHDLPVFVILTLVLVLLKGWHKVYPMLFYGCVLAFILTGYTCAIGGRYEHYYIVFSPLLVLVYACLLHLLKIDAVWKRALLMMLIIGWGGIQVAQKYKFVYVDKTVSVVMNLVEKHSRPEDTMMGDSLVNRAIYAYADRKCANKYLSNAYSPDITEEVLTKMPRVIVHVKSTPLDDSILELYTLAESYKEYEIYVRN